MIEFKQASFSADKRLDPIIKPLDLSIHQGDFMVLLGSNGSGKSTLLKMINARYPITSGEVLIEDKNVSAYQPKELIQTVRCIGQAASDNLFYGLTIYEHARIFIQNLIEKEKLSRELLQNYLARLYPQLATKLDQKVERLSGGEQQILVLGLCLLQKPKVILLDEHTAAMDPKMSAQMMQRTYDIIKDQGITCVMTTHDLDHACMYGNRLIALDEGKVIARMDEYEKQNMTREKLVERCYLHKI